MGHVSDFHSSLSSHQDSRFPSQEKFSPLPSGVSQRPLAPPSLIFGGLSRGWVRDDEVGISSVSSNHFYSGADLQRHLWQAATPEGSRWGVGWAAGWGGRGRRKRGVQSACVKVAGTEGRRSIRVKTRISPGAILRRPSVG